MITNTLIIIALILLFAFGFLVCLVVSIPVSRNRGGVQPKTDPKPKPPKGPKL